MSDVSKHAHEVIRHIINVCEWLGNGGTANIITKRAVIRTIALMLWTD
jgi:hypothetical protein